MLLVANSLNQIWSPYFYKIAKINKDTYVESLSYTYYAFLTLLLSIFAIIILAVYEPLLLFAGGNLVLYSDFAIELTFIFASFIVYTPVWHCRNHLYLKSDGLSILKLTILSSLIGMLFLSIFIFLIGDMGIYVGIFALACFQVLFFCIYVNNSFNASFAFLPILKGLLAVLIACLTLSLNLSILWLLFIFIIIFLVSIFDLKKYIPILINLKWWSIK